MSVGSAKLLKPFIVVNLHGHFVEPWEYAALKEKRDASDVTIHRKYPLEGCVLKVAYLVNLATAQAKIGSRAIMIMAG